MNKRCKTVKQFINYSFVVCFILFNISCGLDTFYVIDPPYSGSNKPSEDENSSGTSLGYAERYFSFQTNEKNVSGFTFSGTDVYYKIYKSSSVMKSELSNINSLTATSNASDKLIHTYKYQKLKALIKNFENSSVLIPSENRNRTVVIRLTDYSSGSDFASKILVDGNNPYNSLVRVVPVRYQSNRTFNFGRNGENDVVPANDNEADGNLDVNMSGSSSDFRWYVAMFAVGVGVDTLFKEIYSTPLFLGTILIDSNFPDN